MSGLRHRQYFYFQMTNVGLERLVRELRGAFEEFRLLGHSVALIAVNDAPLFCTRGGVSVLATVDGLMGWELGTSPIFHRRGLLLTRQQPH